MVAMATHCSGIARASLSTALTLHNAGSRPVTQVCAPRLRLAWQQAVSSTTPWRRLQVQASQSSAVSEGTQTQSSFEVTKSLDKIEVFDLEGNSTVVADLWKDRKVVVGFTRHFGCVLCMKRADLLASRKADFDSANVSLIIIGPGKVEQAQAFAKNTRFPGEVYADPSFSTHEAFEFVSGVATTISLKTGLRVISAYLDGYRQDWQLSSDKETVSKGGWQQGGVLVAGPGKENIIYLFKDEQAGDEPNMDDVVAACCRA